MAVTVRRFVLLHALFIWQGGFVFYAAFVVPAGTRVFGPAGQGAVTARATDALNALGVAALAVAALELGLTADPDRRRTARRWGAWGVAVACHGLLLYLHLLLDYFMDDARRRVELVPPFYPVHRVYLWASTAQ